MTADAETAEKHLRALASFLPRGDHPTSQVPRLLLEMLKRRSCLPDIVNSIMFFGSGLRPFSELAAVWYLLRYARMQTSEFTKLALVFVDPAYASAGACTDAMGSLNLFADALGMDLAELDVFLVPNLSNATAHVRGLRVHLAFAFNMDESVCGEDPPAIEAARAALAAELRANARHCLDSYPCVASLWSTAMGDGRASFEPEFLDRWLERGSNGSPPPR